MKLGAFSISLSVKDLEKSRDFYEKLGFSQMGGSLESNYLIMKNGSTLIGLFQAMFDGNMLTFILVGTRMHKTFILSMMCGKFKSI